MVAAMTQELLSEEREHTLATAWRDKGDKEALRELVTAYIRLVVTVASRYRNYGLPFGDMVQEGNVGLMQAAARFDPGRGVRFSTYATWWIRSSIQEYILRNWSIVRSGTSAAQKALFFNLRWMRARIERNGGVMTDRLKKQIAEQLKVPVADVEAMTQRLSGRDQSLNEPMGPDSDDEWQDHLPAESLNPEEIVIAASERDVRERWLREALTELSPRERLIVEERMLRDEKVTLEEVGQSLGITKERVRQIETKAFNKLRAAVIRRSKAGVASLFGSGTSGALPSMA
jgi:RNA polymerase sigma-32 factor